MTDASVFQGGHWHLYRSNDIGDWELVKTFETLSEAARYILAIEALPVKGLFLEFHVGIDPAPDDEVLGHFEYRGRHAGYVIKKQLH